VNLISTITGLPYVGKTTLFNLLTGGHAATGAFAGAEGETNVGVAKVPDHRVDKLAAMYKPKKTTYAEVTYRDLGLAPRVASGAAGHATQAGQGISAQKLATFAPPTPWSTSFAPSATSFADSASCISWAPACRSSAPPALPKRTRTTRPAGRSAAA